MKRAASTRQSSSSSSSSPASSSSSSSSSSSCSSSSSGRDATKCDLTAKVYLPLIRIAPSFMKNKAVDDRSEDSSAVEAESKLARSFRDAVSLSLASNRQTSDGCLSADSSTSTSSSLSTSTKCDTAARQSLYASLTRCIESSKDRARIEALDAGRVKLHNGHYAHVIRELNADEQVGPYLEKAILLVHSLVLTSPADEASIQVGDLVLQIGPFSRANNWTPDKLKLVADLVSSWPERNHSQKLPLNIVILRMISSAGAEEVALASSARNNSANVVKPASSELGTARPVVKMQIIEFRVQIPFFQTEDVDGKQRGGVLGVILTHYPEPQPLD